MKRIITVLTVICLIAVLVCGCGKKKDNTASGSNSAGSDISTTQGVDEITVSSPEENAVEVDFETGKVISKPANSIGEPSETLEAPSSSNYSTGNSNPSSGSSTTVSSDSSSPKPDSSSESSNSSSSTSSKDENRDGKDGFGNWQ